MIGWDLSQNKEQYSTELLYDSHVFFDKEGEIYAQQNDQVIVLRKQIRLTCFKTDYISKMRNKHQDQDSIFRLSKGFRIDSVNNEWLFLKDFILLPYSYMTFVIS